MRTVRSYILLRAPLPRDLGLHAIQKSHRHFLSDRLGSNPHCHNWPPSVPRQNFLFPRSVGAASDVNNGVFFGHLRITMNVRGMAFIKSQNSVPIHTGRMKQADLPTGHLSLHIKKCKRMGNAIENGGGLHRTLRPSQSCRKQSLSAVQNVTRCELAPHTSQHAATSKGPSCESKDFASISNICQSSRSACCISWFIHAARASKNLPFSPLLITRSISENVVLGLIYRTLNRTSYNNWRRRISLSNGTCGNVPRKSPTITHATVLSHLAGTQRPRRR
jgi:hypothetical protein